jgi:hypothetical protein
MQYNNIPEELRRLHQWVVWRYEMTEGGKPTKLPYNPTTGRLASVTDPSTWCDFMTACNATWNGYSGIGFVFTANDPYCGIDLDYTEDVENFERQKKIYQHTTSYAEYSPSGNGLHIICRARVPHGRKRASIEIYSQERYFTFTGNVYRNAPINDEAAIVSQLWEQMGPKAAPNYFMGTDAPEHFDDELLAKIRRAANADKFERLFQGDWHHDYPSQSEADQALMNFIAFHTQNRPQIARIFRMSALGQRDKAKRDKYLDYSIDKAFDNLLPPIDLAGILDQVNAALSKPVLPGSVAGFSPVQVSTLAAPGAVTDPTAPDPAPQQPSQDFHGFKLDVWRHHTPEGALGLASDFIYAQAPRPVREIALVGALGLLAGITGRAWNVSGTGLNLYLMLLAATGRGKEAAASGINKIASAIEGQYHFPAIWQFIGPADMASGSGLLKHLAERVTPSFVSLTGEVGLRLQQMSNGNANMADITLRRVLLDLYSKSGAGQVIRPTVYSDKKNNIELINSPAFTWLGESTPEEFYKGLDESQIASGLLPRFTIIEYDGPRVPWNDNAYRAYPHQNLLTAIHSIADQALKTMEQGNVQAVNFTRTAHDFSNHINAFADDRINELGTTQNAIAQLWNRLHLKVLKIAAIMAVSRAPVAPVVTEQDIEWACSLCMTDTLNIVRKFETGSVGEEESGLNDNAQHLAIRRIIYRYLTGQITMSATDYAAREKAVITMSFLAQKVYTLAPFKKDRRGPRAALKSAIQDYEDRGILRRVSKQQAQEEIKTEALTLSINNPRYFLADD